jgi:putative transposase
MRLVEKHIISENHIFYKEIDNLCFLSKNLYNLSNYHFRQSFINDCKYLNYKIIQKELQSSADYKALPAKVSQQVLIQLDNNWKSFRASIKDFNENPEKYSGRPRLPRYKDKQKGRFLLVYTIQAISKKELKKGIIKLSGTNIKIDTDKQNIQQVRIIPKNMEYIIEIIYEKEEINLNLNSKNH